jgi:hypothetical protein
MAEDLSDSGLLTWNERIEAHQRAIEAEILKFQSLEDEIALREARQFLAKQQLRFVEQRIYQRGSLPYIELCIFALLPYLADKPIEKFISNMSLKIEHCISWLEAGWKRLVEGELTHSSLTQTLAKKLLETIHQFDLNHPHTLPPRSLQTFIGHLSHWSAFKTQTAPPKSSLSSAKLLSEFLDFPIEMVWVERIEKALHQEINTLNTYRNQRQQARSKMSTEANTITQIDTWFEWLDTKLTNTIRSPSRQTRPARVIHTPQFLVPIIHDALYTPPHIWHEDSIDGRGTLFLTLANSSMDEPLTESLKQGLAIIAAHEIYPGHSEHLHRANASLFAVLFQFTRSDIGFEGWATYTEESVLSLSDHLPNLEGQFRLQRIRRYYYGALQLIKFMPNGNSQGIQKILSELNNNDYNSIIGMKPKGHALFLLNYVIGLLRTEDALISIRSRLLDGQKGTAEEWYLNWGPIAPNDISLLSAKHLQ